MLIGDTPESADEGAALILDGTKTATSSPDWDYPDGRIPFVGALSVLLDGKGRARAIVRTWRVTSIPFGELDEDFARAYGEGGAHARLVPDRHRRLVQARCRPPRCRVLRRNAGHLRMDRSRSAAVSWRVTPSPRPLPLAGEG
jgi:uncharacterized protein YhfF